MTRKGVILFALLACADVAQAQSSVTLYGAVDSSLLWQSTSAATFAPNPAVNPDKGSVFRYKDGGMYSSIIGMTGKEDIGGGYSVNFKLQGSFDSGAGKLQLSDTPGAAAMFNQVASVGIAGPFGSLNAGRQFSPIGYAFSDTDVRGGQFFGSVLTAWLTMDSASGWPGTSTNGSIGALYDSNALIYNSPSFYGASVTLEYTLGGVPGEFSAGSHKSAVLKYSNYGLNFAALYYDGHDANPFPATYPASPAIPATGVDNNRFVYLGAKYTWNRISVSGSFSNGRQPAYENGNPAFGATSGDFDMWTAGLGYRVSPALDLSSGVYYVRDEKHSKNQSTAYVLGAVYYLSKATMLHVDVGYVSNRGAMNQELAYGAPPAPGKNTSAAMLGLRHTF
ncbi:Outer membrane porin protein 32 [Paraburkholderia caffeinitolerans]|uniref:Outer membrane porin protein 32 n=1 Tax=Paraburkholderia caffeinitolerans TaxID=1723730 RepID=A0A6J5GQ74_9BURK|nr:porin [Paraburkholderia caffeinitolerans]CAB3803631.1 Outer membrane porin protein 32 [Paraburkholderia caffeinitolerans]